jgi:hypothetical protein
MRITAQIWEPLLAPLNNKLAAACLQRDAYLDRVFAHEVLMLENELPEPNSEETQQALRKHLREIRDRVPINFTLSHSTVNALDDVCKRKRVPRDCFINRVLLFLVAPQPGLFDRVYGWKISAYFSEVLGAYSFDSPVVPWHLGGPLEVIGEIASGDPFWVFRACIEEANGDSTSTSKEPALHAACIEEELLNDDKQGGLPNALGFNCRLLRCPGPADLKKRLKDLDAFFAEQPPLPDRKERANQR